MPTMKNREPEKAERKEKDSSSKSLLETAREKLREALTPGAVKKVNEALDKK